MTEVEQKDSQIEDLQHDIRESHAEQDRLSERLKSSANECRSLDEAKNSAEQDLSRANAKLQDRSAHYFLIHMSDTLIGFVGSHNLATHQSLSHSFA